MTIPLLYTMFSLECISVVVNIVHCVSNVIVGE